MFCTVSEEAYVYRFLDSDCARISYLLDFQGIIPHVIQCLLHMLMYLYMYVRTPRFTD